MFSQQLFPTNADESQRSFQAQTHLRDQKELSPPPGLWEEVGDRWGSRQRWGHPSGCWEQPLKSDTHHFTELGGLEKLPPKVSIFKN